MLKPLVSLAVLLAPCLVHAQEPADTSATDDSAALAMKLNNPIASLISVPLQGNVDFGAGERDDGSQYQLKIQPVIPISLTHDWNLITRVILPITYQQDLMPASDQGGLGDTLLSLFASPQKPGPGGIIWGAGPVVSIPTATDDILGSGKLGIGPTAVVLRQEGGWTIGMLANHVVSIAGEDERDDVNATFLQPFVSYTNAQHSTLALNTESTYDWEREAWTVPLNLVANQLLRVGSVPMQLGVGPRLYLASPMGGPEWGLRLSLTLLFPR